MKSHNTPKSVSSSSSSSSSSSLPTQALPGVELSKLMDLSLDILQRINRRLGNYDLCVENEIESFHINIKNAFSNFQKLSYKEKIQIMPIFADFLASYPQLDVNARLVYIASLIPNSSFMTEYLYFLIIKFVQNNLLTAETFVAAYYIERNKFYKTIYNDKKYSFGKEDFILNQCNAILQKNSGYNLSYAKALEQLYGLNGTPQNSLAAKNALEALLIKTKNSAIKADVLTQIAQAYMTMITDSMDSSIKASYAKHAIIALAQAVSINNDTIKLYPLIRDFKYDTDCVVEGAKALLNQTTTKGKTRWDIVNETIEFIKYSGKDISLYNELLQERQHLYKAWCITYVDALLKKPGNPNKVIEFINTKMPDNDKHYVRSQYKIALRERAKHYLQAKNYQESCQDYKELVAKFRDHDDYMAYANILCEMGRYADAINVYRDAIDNLKPTKDLFGHIKAILSQCITVSRLDIENGPISLAAVQAIKDIVTMAENNMYLSISDTCAIYSLIQDIPELKAQCAVFDSIKAVILAEGPKKGVVDAVTPYEHTHKNLVYKWINYSIEAMKDDMLDATKKYFLITLQSNVGNKLLKYAHDKVVEKMLTKEKYIFEAQYSSVVSSDATTDDFIIINHANPIPSAPLHCKVDGSVVSDLDEKSVEPSAPSLLISANHSSSSSASSSSSSVAIMQRLVSVPSQFAITMAPFNYVGESGGNELASHSVSSLRKNPINEDYDNELAKQIEGVPNVPQHVLKLKVVEDVKNDKEPGEVERKRLVLS